MATETCPSCGGSGYNSMTGVKPGTQNNDAQRCTHCKGSGTIQKNSSLGKNTDCFPGDTDILTPNGKKKLIELQKGDSVLSITPRGEILVGKIKRKVSHSSHPILKVISQTSELSFYATKRHPVKTERGWVRIKDLIKGDTLFCVNGNGDLVQHYVDSVKTTERYEPVFNIVVDGNHTFIVHGCVAHSFVYFRSVRTLIHAVIPFVLENIYRKRSKSPRYQ